MTSVLSQPPELDESAVIRATQEYLAALERGTRPDREEFLARFPAIAGALALCLDNLELLQAAAPGLSSVGLAAAPELRADFGNKPLGDFRIVREVGRGGMGIVYEAEQLSLGRRVALKVLPFASALDPRHLQRFKNEALAAAQLHHGHIAPVFGVGSERGLHYYAMQFIDGHTLAELIGDLQAKADKSTREIRALNAGGEEPRDSSTALIGEASASSPGYFRTIAEWAVQAAEALEHAHGLGIIHRDVKPANLMVDARRQVWVTDFGLARLADEGNVTATGDLVGTLRYMSPEQALARHGLVDHRTDIYSLGATVYELLTLTPAFASADRQELLREIAADDPLPPSKHVKTISADLETIVLKALAKEPESRYASAREMAADLQRYLDSKPILARRPSLADRGRKWVRRHQALAGAAVAVLFIAVLALAVSTWLVGRKWKEAEARRQDAMDAVNAMFTEVAEDWLAGQPHLETKQRRFLDRALRFYQKLAAADDHDPTVRYERAAALRRLGDIHHKLGDDGDAETVYAQAIAILESLTAAAADNPPFLRELALCHTKAGMLLRDTGRHEQAEGVFRHALAIRQRTAERFPSATVHQWELANGRQNLGLLLRELGRPQEAEQVLRQALALEEKLAADAPQLPEYRRELAASYDNLGLLLRDLGRYGDAQAAHRSALSVREQLKSESPESAMDWSGLAASHTYLGQVHEALGRADEAAKELQTALGLREKLASYYPNVPTYRRDLAAEHYRSGETLAALGNKQSAERYYNRAIALLDELAQDFPNVPAYRMDLAGVHDRVGLLLHGDGRMDAAEKSLRRALALLAQVVNDCPEVPAYRRALAAAHYHLGAVLVEYSRDADAEHALGSALTAAEELARSFPRLPDYRKDLADIHRQLALLYQLQGKAEATDRALQKAVALLDQLTTECPGVPNYHHHAARAEYQRANWLHDRGQSAEAVNEFTAALARFERLAREFPLLTELRQEWAWLLVACPTPECRNVELAQTLAQEGIRLTPKSADWRRIQGLACLRAGDAGAAAAALRLALELRGENPTDGFLLALAHQENGESQQAQAWYDRSCAWMDQKHVRSLDLMRLRSEAAAGLHGGERGAPPGAADPKADRPD